MATATITLKVDNKARLMNITASLDDRTRFPTERIGSSPPNGSSPPSARNADHSFSIDDSETKGFEGGASCSYKTSDSSVDNKNRIKADDKDFSHIPANIRKQFLEILYYDGVDIPQEYINIPRRVKRYFVQYLYSEYKSNKLTIDDIVESRNPFIKFVSYDAITYGTEMLLNKFCPGRKIRYK